MAKILKNFNLFVDGRGYVGRVEELTPPKLSIKTEELRAGGMDAPVSIDMGMEKLEASFSLIEFDSEILKQFGLTNGSGVALTLRGALVDDTNTTPMIIKLQGKFTEIDMGKFKAGDKGSMGCSVACHYYSLEMDNKKIIEIDINNMTRIIDGVDALSEIRSAIGL